MTPDKLRTGNDGLDANGKPLPWNVEGYDRAAALFAADTRPTTLEKLRSELDRIRALFLNGDVQSLLKIMADTAPVAYEDSGYSLGEAQVLNDYAASALSRLIGEDAVRSLMYHYQSAYGQDSHHVTTERQLAAAGLLGDEAQESAIAEIRRKNPDPNDTLQEQQEAIRRVLKGLKKKRAE